MTAETQLDVYNNALLLCEERMLSSLTEARKPRFLLDQVWNNGGPQACLEEGEWAWSLNTVSVTYNPNVKPPFAFLYAYQKPTDWVRTVGISSDPYFQTPLTQYADENGWWFSDVATIYVKYVSSLPTYGMNLTLWPETFKQFVAAHHASKIVPSLTHDKTIQDRVMEARKRSLFSARGKDEINKPTMFFPRGQLSRARMGMYWGRPGSGNSDGWY